MLTIETLRQNSALSALSDDQLSAIADMSKNDEASVIGTRIGELHGQYDNDVLSITGIQKNVGEKSYDYVKRVLNDYKSTTANTESKLQGYKTKISDLEKQIENGGDEAIKQQLVDSKNLVASLQTQVTEKDKLITEEKQSYEAKLKNVHVQYAFDSALQSLNIKAGTSDSVKTIMFEAAKKEVLEKAVPEYAEVDGKNVVIFRDKNGAILTNAAKNMEPLTPYDLLMQTSVKDIIDTGKKQPGGGTHENPGDGGNDTNIVDLSSARSQIEADNIISKHLMQLGLTRDSEEFAAESARLRADNNVSKLPIR